jgi:hypothetical protein
MSNHIGIAKNNINRENSHDLSGFKDLKSKVLNEIDPDIAEEESHDKDGIDKENNKD